MTQYKTGKLKQNEKLQRDCWGDVLSNMRVGTYSVDIIRTKALGEEEESRTLAITNIPDFHTQLPGYSKDDADKILKAYFYSNKNFKPDGVSFLMHLQEQTRLTYLPSIIFNDAKGGMYRNIASKEEDIWSHTYIPQKDGGIVFRQISFRHIHTFNVCDAKDETPQIDSDGDKLLQTDFPEPPGAILDVQETTIKWQDMDAICKNTYIDKDTKSDFHTLSNYINAPSVEALYAYLQPLGIDQNGADKILRQLTGDGEKRIIFDNNEYIFTHQDEKWVPQFVITGGKKVPNPVRIEDGKLQVMFASKIERNITVNHRDDLFLGSSNIDDRQHECCLGIDNGTDMDYSKALTSPYVLHVGAFKEALSSIQKLYDSTRSLPPGTEQQVVYLWKCLIEPHIQKPGFVDDADLLLSLFETLDQYATSCPPLQSTLSDLANSNSMEAAIKKATMEAAIKKATEVPPIYNTLVMATVAIVATAIAYFFFPTFVPIVSAISIAAVLIMEIGSSLRAHDPIKPGYSPVSTKELRSQREDASSHDNSLSPSRVKQKDSTPEGCETGRASPNSVVVNPSPDTYGKEKNLQVGG